MDTLALPWRYASVPASRCRAKLAGRSSHFEKMPSIALNRGAPWLGKQAAVFANEAFPNVGVAVRPALIGNGVEARDEGVVLFRVRALAVEAVDHLDDDVAQLLRRVVLERGADGAKAGSRMHVPKRRRERLGKRREFSFGVVPVQLGYENVRAIQRPRAGWKPIRDHAGCTVEIRDISEPG